jgi:hypothetical protein
MVTALVLGSMALAVTGTLGTAVHSHSLDTGLLWILCEKEGARGAVMGVYSQGGVKCGNNTQQQQLIHTQILCTIASQNTPQTLHSSRHPLSLFILYI